MLGDVMGHGSVSAARAGQLHSVIATLALEGHGPGALLGRLGSGIEQIMDLELATLLVLFSDGLVERRGESISTGLEKLRRAVNELRLPPEVVADHLLDELGCTGGGEDDVALLSHF